MIIGGTIIATNYSTYNGAYIIAGNIGATHNGTKSACIIGTNTCAYNIGTISVPLLLALVPVALPLVVAMIMPLVVALALAPQVVPTLALALKVPVHLVQALVLVLMALVLLHLGALCAKHLVPLALRCMAPASALH